MLGKVGPHGGHLFGHGLVLVGLDGVGDVEQVVEEEEEVVSMRHAEVFAAGTALNAIELVEGAAGLVGQLVQEHGLGVCPSTYTVRATRLCHRLRGIN